MQLIKQASISITLGSSSFESPCLSTTPLLMQNLYVPPQLSGVLQCWLYQRYVSKLFFRKSRDLDSFDKSCLPFMKNYDPTLVRNVILREKWTCISTSLVSYQTLMVIVKASWSCQGSFSLVYCFRMKFIIQMLSTDAYIGLLLLSLFIQLMKIRNLYSLLFILCEVKCDCHIHK